MPDTSDAHTAHRGDDSREARTSGALPAPASCSIDLDAEGRSIGTFSVPWSRDESGWGNVLTPIAVIANGEGPTVLLTGGNHGDEFEGPVALRRLLHEVEVERVSGRIIVVPGLNQAALRVGRRLSPVDGGNLNRSFPGNPVGTPTQRIADFVFRELVKRADLVLDIHSGGQSMTFEPMIATHVLADERRTAETAEYIKVFGTPLAVLIDEPDPNGLLDSAVEDLGKVFLTTEIQGGRAISARTVDITHRGVVNTLKQAGVLAGEPEFDAPPTFVRMVDDGTSVATIGGLFEPLADPGDEVTAGDPVARIHPIDDLAAPPSVLRSGVNGIVIMRHNPGLIESGDPAITVAVHEAAPW
ncbi:succinylglutamate desuccinylase/aspartoacylase domain-containing protein [Ilumatobacter nonamiensis]|uniref:succinylglutamate desuccinylase/aspartoacylase domain-containing protein n=1 Tax=Ilumatobacter nonamiensis TaxID=467093 RepID=UPI00034B3729|nr:succinylglutamate desuccinylase/aspartoacylase family protein [Ilumatobacter nonamiensis]